MTLTSEDSQLYYGGKHTPRFSIFNADCLAVLKALDSESADSLVTDPPAGISFMGKNWDSDKGGRDQWVAWLTGVMAECFRVLKPGAHGLVWALPRTSHWTATALENAGFEIRDVIVHLFGTGFPKSLDISKAIDKAAGAERSRVPIIDVSTGKAKSPDIDGGMFKPGKKFTAYSNDPITEAAKQWQGYGTALKPASEHWILIRKPLAEKTVAANVLKHGTGGINIDGCRIGTADSLNGGAYSKDKSKVCEVYGNLNYDCGEYVAPLGRFPANLVLSHNDDCENECTEGCAVKMLDEQSGVLKSGGYQNGSPIRTKGTKGDGLWLSLRGVDHANTHPGDSGGASRFFYTAKASKSDKGDFNKHPTVKSQNLMRYLCRMVTPKGGTMLDPFAGSGTTGVAALQERFSFIGMEKDKDSYTTAAKRLHKTPQKNIV